MEDQSFDGKPFIDLGADGSTYCDKCYLSTRVKRSAPQKVIATVPIITLMVQGMLVEFGCAVVADEFYKGEAKNYRQITRAAGWGGAMSFFKHQMG